MVFLTISIVILAVTILLLIVTKNINCIFLSGIALFFVINSLQKMQTITIIMFCVLFAASIYMLTAEKSEKWFRRISCITSTIALVILVFVVAGSLYVPAKQPTVNHPKLPSVTNIVKNTTWQMKDGDYGSNRWFGDGIAEIKNAKTDAEAADAANVWLEKVKTDSNLLVGAAKYFLKTDIDKASLVTSDGWATDKAVQTVAQLRILLSQSKVISSNAPANGYNSGVENNIVVGASNAGINGNVKAVKVTLPDGNVVWIMARCGNLVTPGKPSVPPGKTDNTPPVKPPVIPVKPVIPLTPKDPAADPAPKGNAPVGGGKNQDPGPGTYVPPSSMEQPPSTPRVNPTPPKSTTPSGTGSTPSTTPTIPAGSTPDPTPAPPAEPAAPTPTSPATGTTTVPGL